MAADATKGSLRAASPEQTQWLQRIRWFDFCAHLCLRTMLLPHRVLYVKDYTRGCGRMKIELAATFTKQCLQHSLSLAAATEMSARAFRWKRLCM